MLRKGINARLVKGGKPYGVIQSWVSEENAQKKVIIGWSTAKDPSKFDAVKCELNAFNRSKTELFIPKALQKDMARFCRRCHMYYKDCLFPDWMEVPGHEC